VGSKLTLVANWLPSVFYAAGWVIRPVKIVRDMAYNVSSGMLSLYSLTHAFDAA